MAVDMDGCQSGLLSLFAKEMSFIKTTTGSNPVPSSIYSWVVQWWSIWLLTRELQVRVLPQEPCRCSQDG